MDESSPDPIPVLNVMTCVSIKHKQIVFIGVFRGRVVGVATPLLVGKFYQIVHFCVKLACKAERYIGITLSGVCLYVW